jgi:hypothetical protein
MSVTRTQTTTMNDQKTLCDALKAIGEKPTTQTAATVRGHGSEKSREKCDIVLRKEDTGRGADIGFSKGTDGNYMIVTDTYVNRDLNGNKLEEFSNRLKQNYSKINARKAAAKAGGVFMGERAVNGKIVMRFAVKA